MGFTTDFELYFQAARLLEDLYKYPKMVSTKTSPLWTAVFRLTLGQGSRTSTKSGHILKAEFPWTPWGREFSNWLLPIHSLFLWKSFLVPFPPVNDMLKFRGLSHQISGLKNKIQFSLLTLTDVVFPRQKTGERREYTMGLAAFERQETCTILAPRVRRSDGHFLMASIDI